MKVLSVGMIVCDIVLSPIPKNIFNIDSIQIETPLITLGGDALNVSVGLSKLGIESKILGKIGKDINGDFVKKSLINVGVDTSSIIEDKDYNTAVSYVLVDEDKERHFLTNNKIFEALRYEDIDINVVSEQDIVYFGSLMSMRNMDMEGILKLFKEAHKYNCITAMDAAISYEVNNNFMLEKEEIFYETDIFIPSYDEAIFLTKERDIDKIKKQFQKYGIKVFGIKLGKKGCYITDFREEYYIDTYNFIEVKDTTGAGDSFISGFLRGYLEGWDILRCGIFANTVASLNVSKRGASCGIPSFDEAKDFMNKNETKLHFIKNKF